MKKIIIVAACMALIACKKSPTENTFKIETLTEINPKLELEKWKKEIIDTKQLGQPCNFTSISSPEAIQWEKDNSDLMNGLPSLETEYKLVQEDLDGDTKKDLLMYFMANNCSGHNGGTPSLAKVIYANGQVNHQLMSEIKKAILGNYAQQKAKNSQLKAVTDDYLDGTLGIEYKNGIIGECQLYTKDDGHCCPSYSVSYNYNLKTKKADIKISPNPQ